MNSWDGRNAVSTLEQRYIAIGVLAALWVLESLIPFFTDQLPSVRLRLRHDARNFAWGIVNSILGAVFVSTALVTVDSLAATQQMGLRS